MSAGPEPPQAPRLARVLLERALPPDVREDISGDLDELFHQRRESRGARHARRWHWSQVLAFSIRFLWERLRERATLGRRAAPPHRTITPWHARGRKEGAWFWWL